MPNGFQGSKEEWERIQSFLLEIDELLLDFAKVNGMELSKNYHNWPERSITWGEDIRRLIQIYLDDEKIMTFNFWICASQDRGQKRYWKNTFLKKGVHFFEIKDNLLHLLEEGHRILESWFEKDLEFATKISKL